MLNPMPKTLAAAHEALIKIQPSRQAPLTSWRKFHQLGAKVYTEIADIDRHHHHEALYFARYEREKVEEITRELGS